MFDSFSLETLLAAAFGRSVDIQGGKADELMEAVKCCYTLFQKGQLMSVDAIQLLYSMSNIQLLQILSCLLSYMSGYLSYSWFVSALRFVADHSNTGRGVHKLEELVLALIKARRESDNPEKVWCNSIRCTVAISGQITHNYEELLTFIFFSIRICCS